MAKGNPMHRLQIRLPPDLMERVKWTAQGQGIEFAECIRRILNAATKDARPPDRIDERVVAASDEEWKAWRDTAAQVGMSLDDLLRRQMNGLVKRVFEPK